jgi:hypothetical protein
MPIDIRVEDTELAGFSDPAKEGVKKAGEDFLKKIIVEANRLESVQNSGGGPVEITKGMVATAAMFQNHAVGPQKTSLTIKLLRIAAAALSLAVGIMYDKDRLQDAIYLLVFVLVIAAALLATILSTLKE